MDSPNVPSGFTPHLRQSGLTAPWEPLFSRRTDDGVFIGFRAAAPHTNSRQFVHGGLISALADNAMGLSCGMALAGAAGLVTVTLTMDFVASGKVGEWIEFRPSVVKTGATLCFASVLVFANDAVCARGNAVFRVLSRQN